MYNRISYKYILLSVLAHLAFILGVVVVPSAPDNPAESRYLNPDEKIMVKFYEAAQEPPTLAAKEQEPPIDKKDELTIPEKRVLDFSDLPPGEEPEKAVVSGRTSSRARNDFYQNRSDRVQQSKTVAAPPQQRTARLVLRKPSLSLDARISKELSKPSKALTREKMEAAEIPASGTEDNDPGLKEPRSRTMQVRTRQPKPGLDKPDYENIQRPEKREIIKGQNIFARLMPRPGERGPEKEVPDTVSDLPVDIKERIREPRMLEKNTGGIREWSNQKKPEPRWRKPEISASRDLGLELSGPPDVYEMIVQSVDRLEQSPDIPAITLGEHASIKNSDRDASNDSDAKVISMDTQELKYVSYFWHLKQKIGNVWSYPSEAVRLGMQGTVIVRMSLLKTGRLEKVQLVRSSGFSILDIEARDAVISAGPFPPFPEQIKDQKLVIEGYFRYFRGGWTGSRR